MNKGSHVDFVPRVHYWYKVGENAGSYRLFQAVQEAIDVMTSKAFTISLEWTVGALLCSGRIDILSMQQNMLLIRGSAMHLQLRSHATTPLIYLGHAWVHQERKSLHIWPQYCKDTQYQMHPLSNSKARDIRLFHKAIATFYGCLVGKFGRIKRTWVKMETEWELNKGRDVQLWASVHGGGKLNSPTAPK